jgi:NAD(P)-dependent dehydrogenase (short-subunit alcohol dehydrogenase family)
MQTVVVTGAASGIGEACYNVLSNSSDFAPFGLDVKASPRTDLVMNLASHAEIDEAAGIIGQRFKHIAGLVNCAGVQIKKPLSELTHENWLESLSVNAVAPFFLLGKLLPLFEGGGSVVNIGSVHATATTKGMAAYSASKGALASASRAAAIELAKFGVRVNCVSPGAVDTLMLTENLMKSGLGGDEPLRMLEESIPLCRVGSPVEVAQLVLFLLTEESRYITGGEFPVDGGVLAVLASEASRHRPVDSA